MEELASWSFTGAQDTGATPAAEEASSVDATARLKVVARRYYPVGIGAAFLLMVAGFFPSTSPLLLGGSFFSAPAASAPSNHPGAPAPTTEQPLVSSSSPGGFGFSVSPTNNANFPVESPAGTSAEETPAPSSSTPPSGTGGTVPPSTQCPVPLPGPSTTADSLLAEVASVCDDLLGSKASGAAGASGDWVYLGRLTHVQGAPANGTTQRAGTAVVLVGLDPTTAALSSRQQTSSLSNTFSSLMRSGALVGILAVADPGASNPLPGKPPVDFADFAGKISTSFGSVPLIGVATPVSGSSGTASSNSQEATEVVEGLTSLESRHLQTQSVGIWLGNASNGCIGSTQISSALVSAAASSARTSGVWHEVKFLGAASAGTAACGNAPSLSAQGTALSLPLGLTELLSGQFQPAR